MMRNREAKRKKENEVEGSVKRKKENEVEGSVKKRRGKTLRQKEA